MMSFNNVKEFFKIIVALEIRIGDDILNLTDKWRSELSLNATKQRHRKRRWNNEYTDLTKKYVTVYLVGLYLALGIEPRTYPLGYHYTSFEGEAKVFIGEGFKFKNLINFLTKNIFVVSSLI